MADPKCTPTSDALPIGAELYSILDAMGVDSWTSNDVSMFTRWLESREADAFTRGANHNPDDVIVLPRSEAGDLMYAAGECASIGYFLSHRDEVGLYAKVEAVFAELCRWREWAATSFYDMRDPLNMTDAELRRAVDVAYGEK